MFFFFFMAFSSEGFRQKNTIEIWILEPMILTNTF